MNKLLVLCLIMSLSTSIWGQHGISEKETLSDGRITYARFKKDSVKFSSQNSLLLLRTLFKTQQNDNFQLTKVKRDEFGFDHQYFQQYYKGFRVSNGNFNIQGKDNSIVTFNGEYQQIKDVNVTPNFSEGDALGLALKAIGASSYKWQIPNEEKWLKENFNQSYFPKGELIIRKGNIKFSGEYRLVWRFDIYAHYPMRRDYIYIDALSGDVVDQSPAIHDTNVSGSATTRYSGSRTITTDSFVGGFRLKETRNNVPIQTFNMLGQGANLSSSVDFIDNDNSWVEYNNANKDDAALDAHWATEQVYDYWLSKGRNSLDGLGLPLFSYVHQDLPALGLGANNDNAKWDGIRMLYGDGTTTFNPLTALDVCAHETGHGVMRYTAYLEYAGESGALNESLSDIWGAVIEAGAAPNKSKWLCGEDITKVSPFFLRSMSNPNSGLIPQPDTYNGTNWASTANPTLQNDMGGVHTNSGVPNFWFFLLCEGGSGTNDLGKCFNVTGIGMTKAAQIVYYVQNNLMASSSEQNKNFSYFRTQTISAATSLFPGSTNEVQQVINAWYAVGIPAAPTVSIVKSSNNYEICNGETWTFTANTNLGDNLGYDWYTLNSTQVPTSDILINGGNHNQFTGFVHTPNKTITVTANQGYGIFWVYVRTANGSCLGTYGPSSQSSAGTINNSQFSVSGPSSLCKNTVGYFNATTPFAQNITGYNWSWSNGFSSASGQGTPYLSASASTSFSGGVITLQLKNRCGWTGVPAMRSVGNYGCFSFMASPNPVANTIEVRVEDDGVGTSLNEAKNESRILNVINAVLVDHSGQKMLSWSVENNIQSVDVSKIPNGIYVLKLSNGTSVSSQKILIEH